MSFQAVATSELGLGSRPVHVNEGGGVTIYLPIAELTVNLLLILGIGTAVGFISGLFGVGGGFLLTPLLIFSGISPAVVVASEASQIAATAFSGAVAYGRKSLIDFKLGAVLVAGGAVGSGLGVWLFSLLRQVGQLDFAIGIAYVLLLGSIGTLMLKEALATMRAQATGTPRPSMRKAGDHGWAHGLPLKMRFHKAKIYMSAIPVIALGAAVGVIGSVLGVGGGFLTVPALIYLFRVPTTIAIGVSLFYTVATMSVASLLHATTNLSVDIVLSMLLMIGGVIGAQYGAAVGHQMKGEELRALLAVLILAVAARFFYEFVAVPERLYTISIPEFGP